jgi:hypothetical protein
MVRSAIIALAAFATTSVLILVQDAAFGISLLG